MFFGGGEETLCTAFHKLFNSGDFKFDMESFIPNEPGSSRGLSEKPVLMTGIKIIPLFIVRFLAFYRAASPRAGSMIRMPPQIKQ